MRLTRTVKTAERFHLSPNKPSDLNNRSPNYIDNTNTRIVNILFADFPDSYSDISTRANVKEEIIWNLADVTGMQPDRINDFFGTWADSSSSNEMALAKQVAADKEFGSILSEWQEEVVSYSDLDEALVQDAQKLLRSIYNETQSWFQKNGYKPDDEIVLFRGVFGNADQNGEEIEKKVSYRGTALDSWSVFYPSSAEFGAVLGQKVKIKNILSTARTGFGCLVEGEMVVIGNSLPGAQVEIIGYSREE